VHVPLLHDISVADDGEKALLTLNPSLALPELLNESAKEHDGFITIL
jgi:hypothetical protein